MSRSKYINTFYTEDDFNAYIESDLPEFPNIAYQKYLDHVEITMTKPALPVWRGELSDNFSGTLPYINLDSVENRPGMNQDMTKFILSSWSNEAPTRISIYNANEIKTIEIFNIDTSNVTQMLMLFQSCSSLTSVNLTKFNTSNVTDMASMFSGCSSLTSLDLSNFNTSNVKYMNGMFDGCSSLTSLDLSNFDTSNVTTISEMFDGCSSLTSIDLSNFNASNVRSMDKMFRKCSSLTSLDLSNFNTSALTNMEFMFDGCSSLTSLDLSNVNIENYSPMDSDHRHMFRNCTSLTDVYINNDITLGALTSDFTMAGDESNEYRFIPSSVTIHFNSDPSNPEMIENYVWSGSSWDLE